MNPDEHDIDLSKEVLKLWICNECGVMVWRDRGQLHIEWHQELKNNSKE